MTTTFQYTIDADETFPNRKVDLPRFTQEIQASTITVALASGSPSVAGGNCVIQFKSDLSDPEALTLEGLVKAHSGEPLPAPTQSVSVVGISATSEGRLPTAAARPIAPKLTKISPNWCDKTTWYGDSEEVMDEVATDSGDHTTYSVSHQFLIDVYHGKITFEEQLKDDDGSNYRIRVKVNDVEKVEQDPHFGAGGDYTVNYAAGTVTFLTALQPSDVVKVRYHYAQTSLFIITPIPAKKMLIGTVEVQFSEDAVMNDTIVFQAYGLVDVFAPQLMPGIPSGTKIPIGDPLVYKTFADLLNDSNGAYPAYPAFGGSNWRSLKKAAYLFVWDYTVGATLLSSAAGMEIHVQLQHNTPIGGAYAVATFYCTSEDEEE